MRFYFYTKNEVRLLNYCTVKLTPGTRFYRPVSSQMKWQIQSEQNNMLMAGIMETIGVARLIKFEKSWRIH